MIFKYDKVRFHYGDQYRIIGHLNFKKVWNVAVVLLSYYISRVFRRPVVWGQPFSLSIEPTTSCNLRCPECPSGLRSFTRDTGMLELDLFKKIVDDSHEKLIYLMLYFQGEPYLHPQFNELIKYAKQRKLYTATSTNAHFLDDENARKAVESGIDRLIISIDGATQETYSAYRVGGKLSKVLDGTKNLVKWKKKLGSKTPHLIFQFLVVKPNEHELDKIKIMADELGVDEVRFKTAQVYEYENGNPLIPDNQKYARYKKAKDGKYVVKNPLSNHCWKIWHSAVSTWDGNIVPCCFDKDATHQMGNMQTGSLKEIWTNEPYTRFRTALLKSRKEIDICKNCTEGLKVWG